MGDVIQGRWLDVHRVFREGCGAVVQDVGRTLAAEGFDLAVEAVPLPARTWQFGEVIDNDEELEALARETAGQEAPEKLSGLGILGRAGIGAAALFAVAWPVGLIMLGGLAAEARNRKMKRRQAEEARVRTQAQALAFIQESAAQARTEMRRDIKGHLEKTRRSMEAAIAERIGERSADLEEELAAHQSRLKAATDERERERGDAEARLGAITSLEEAATALLAELKAT